jgi:vesicular inhibitory amino acid transporter
MAHTRGEQAIFGLVGFLTFAQYTQEEVSNNLPSQTFKVYHTGSHNAHTLLQICLNTVLVFKALLSYPLPFYATARIMEENLFQGPPKTVLPCAYGDDKQASSCHMVTILTTP